jgi:hypothetical protein
MIYLMHINTGSIDTLDNWLAEANENGWDFDAAYNESLVEIKKINGEWVEQ